MARTMNNTIVVIPARGGSKSITLKNLQRLGKYTLLEHTIADAYALKCPIYVTTDHPKIGLVAQEADAVVIKRAPELAQDESQAEDAILDVLNRMSVDPETIVVFLQCTSPFRHPDDLVNAVDYFSKGYCDSMYSAYKLNPFVWTEDGNRAQYRTSERPNRQLKTPLYVEDGNFYISRAKSYYDNHCRLSGRIGRWLHDKIYGLEVDEWNDLETARLLLPWLQKLGKV
jgi:CMP-N,N'-diacetyllegionaminic acid synthase